MIVFKKTRRKCGSFSAVKTAMTILLRIPVVTFSHTRAVKSTRSMTRESQVFLKRSSAEMLCLCSKTYCCYDAKSDKYKFSSKGLNKRTIEDCGDGPMTKYRRVLADQNNVTSANRGFRTKEPSIATYEQTKRDSLTFIQNE